MYVDRVINIIDQLFLDSYEDDSHDLHRADPS